MTRLPLQGAILLICLTAARAQAQTPVVSRVEVTGASDPTLTRYVSVQAGQPRDPEAIRASVLLLSAMDVFDQVEVEEEAQGDGTIRMIFHVVETPKVGELIFVTRPTDGLADVPLPNTLAKPLSSVSGLRRGEPFRDKSLAEATTRMTEWLRAHAYPRAMAEVVPQPPPNGPSNGIERDIRVRVLEIQQEKLVSSRINGWPAGLPSPKSPARVGEALTDERVKAWRDQLLALLWKNAYYRAQVRVESVAGDLVFFVTPGLPYDLKLDRLSEKEKSKARARFEQEGLSQDAIEETMSTIEADFVKRGYRDIEVDFLETPAGGRVTGEFVARPGAAWILGAVEYQTDGVLSPRLSPLALGAPWIDADVSAERTRLLTELLQQGYAGATVTHEESGDPGNAKVTFKIVPGSLSTVASVAILNAPPLADRGRDSVIELKTRETQPFRSVDVTRDRAALVTSLRDDGYVDAKVEATAEFSDDRRTVAVSFHVTPGPRVRVGRILVVGLEVTKPVVVLRESRLKEGDFLSFQKLLDTQSSLSATGLFSSVQVRELTNASDQRDLIIEVTEGPRTTVTPGLGYQKTESWRVSAELTRLNVSGRGRTMSAILRSSLAGSKKAVLALTEPYAFGRRQTVRVQFYGEDDRSRGAFDFQRVGFQAETPFPVPGGSIIAKYTFQKTLTRNVETDCAEIDRTLCDGKVSGPSLAYVHDTRNDPINPRRGTVYSMETLFSAAALGGDSFVKGTAFLAHYEEVRAGTVIAGAARIGLARAFGTSVELPLPERFFAGGPSVMRAFNTDEVGPGYYNADSVFVPNGGNALLALALEARVDLVRGFGFQVFGETGNVFPTTNAMRLSDLREVAGVGLNWQSPVGPIRLDWGFKLDKRPSEDRHVFHLAVGYAF
ncbi:MAG: BamA/TamA family outer membrane protein [Vicinamibacteria bacterium]|nr:BamA/TamA family outer membrane protein [Vicinamibacteria bacterium]